MTFLIRILINAAALWVATRFVDGITFQGDWVRLLGVALVFGLVNAIVRPIVKLLTLPLLILTLGLFTFVINALMRKEVLQRRDYPLGDEAYTAPLLPARHTEPLVLASADAPTPYVGPMAAG